jgi:prepilin-type N-terminal cleavage/methylation domain-containing protein
MKSRNSYWNLRKGFSLAELMIAIGIMGIGMVMVATLFPTALKQNEFSLNDTIGTIIADNAAAMAEATVQQSRVTSTSLTVVADEQNTSIISYANQHYDTANAADPNRQGFILLGMKDPNNGHLLVVVPYIKKGGGNDVVEAHNPAVQINATPSNKIAFTTPSDFDSYVKPDSPVILPSTGEYATIIEIDASQKTATLDRNLIVNDSNAWVICERISPGAYAGRSPALTPLVIRTDLQP